jgi:hypothetical protein
MLSARSARQRPSDRELVTWQAALKRRPTNGFIRLVVLSALSSALLCSALRSVRVSSGPLIRKPSCFTPDQAHSLLTPGNDDTHFHLVPRSRMVLLSLNVFMPCFSLFLISCCLLCSYFVLFYFIFIPLYVPIYKDHHKLVLLLRMSLRNCLTGPIFTFINNTAVLILRFYMEFASNIKVYCIKS